MRGKHGRGATVFSFAPLGGLLKRNGNVYTQVVKNCSKKELEPLILKHTGLGTVYSDKWAAYDGLVNYTVKEHHRINHGADEFASNHINRELLGLC